MVHFFSALIKLVSIMQWQIPLQPWLIRLDEEFLDEKHNPL